MPLAQGTSSKASALAAIMRNLYSAKSWAGIEPQSQAWPEGTDRPLAICAAICRCEQAVPICEFEAGTPS